MAKAHQRQKLLRALEQLPGIQVIASRQSRREQRFMLDLVRCARPRAYLLLRSWRNQILYIEEFASYHEARYHFRSGGEPIPLAPRVAAVLATQRRSEALIRQMHRLPGVRLCFTKHRRW